MKPETLSQFLTIAVQNKASDVHLQVGEHPLFRINGQLAQVKYHPLSSQEMASIVSIEEPIEFLFKNKSSVISQREVGTDTGSFKAALHAAMRQDPDVIVVGEMRDRETVDIALRAAETGHLVVSTIHTPDAQRTVNRLI